MTRIALLADIHGNLSALEAVIDELECRQPDLIVVNGDLINGVPFSSQVIDRVRALDWLVIRGNHEFYYLDWGTERAVPGSEDPKRWGQLHWLMEQITPVQAHYLATMPDARTLFLPGTQPVCVAHGVPGNNRVGFYNQQPEAQIADKLEPIRERTVVSAHSHVQIDRRIERRTDGMTALQWGPDSDMQNHAQPAVRRWHLINPGSVGLPFNKDPRAQFTIMDVNPLDDQWGGWRVEQIRIPYDRRPALAAYEESGMMAAGGVISRLFYWGLVTAEAEVFHFNHWAHKHGYDPDGDSQGAFRAYIEATGRDQFVRVRDPLLNGKES